MGRKGGGKKGFMKAAAGATGSVPRVDADTDGAEPTDAVDIVEPTPREEPTSRFTERMDEDSQERQETLSQLRARHVKVSLRPTAP
jgi:hypothetical protein